MKKYTLRGARVLLIASVVTSGMVLVAQHFYLYGQQKAGFPEGFDAVEAAPASHKIVFENQFIRVLQVTLPPPGSSEPMHHHRWPSVFLGYDTGGKSPHIRYHTPDGRVRDQPSGDEPVHAGVWTANWLAPEPMHSIEVVENPTAGPPGSPRGWLRVEIKCIPR